MKNKDAKLLAEAYTKIKQAVNIEDLARQEPQEMEGTSGSEESFIDTENNDLENAITVAIEKYDPEINYKKFASIVSSIIKDQFGQHLKDEFIQELQKNF